MSSTASDPAWNEQSARIQQAAPNRPAANHEQRGNQPVSKKMKVTIGSKTFTATLDNNPAAAELKAMLPVTLDMDELNGNEKYSRLVKPLPADDAIPGTIRAGGLLLWQADTLVLFYKTFRSTYSYTWLGSIDDPTGLAAAVGSGSVIVTFELE